MFCETCKWRDSQLGDDLSTVSVCRRYPPSVIPVPVQNVRGMGIQMHSVWPPVNPAKDSCGEHAPSLGVAP